MKKDYQNYWRLIGYAKKHIPLYVICTILCGAMFFLIFSSVGVLLSSVVAAVSGEPTATFQDMLLYVIGLFLFSILASFSQVGFIKIEQRTQMVLREKMLHQYLRMKESVAIKYPSNEVLNRLSSDVPNCTTVIGNYMSSMVFQPMLSGIFSILLLLVIDWRVAFLCILCTGLSFLCSELYVKRLRELKSSTIKEKSDTANFIEECTKGETEIRSFHLFPIFKTQLEHQMNDTERSIQKFSFFQAIRIRLYIFSADCLTLISLLTLGALLSDAGIIQFSDIMMALPLSDQINQLMTAFGNGSAIIRQASPHMERVFEIMGLEEESISSPKEERTLVEQKDTQVSFSNVSFSYGEKTVLHDISFNIQKGEKVAFVGESGSGKSTIMKLLLGLYSIEQGKIQACSRQLGHCSIKEWRENFSYLPQEISMFHLTVAQNISLSLYKAGEAILDAAKRANVQEFLSQTKEGYDLILGENNDGFSGGQLQRIALARCLFKNAPIILMDEPTSALDPDSEQAVKESIEQLPKDCTVVAVTHRLELTKNFDKLYVVERGRIVESGTHKQLLEQGGKYYHLWKLQSS